MLLLGYCRSIMGNRGRGEVGWECDLKQRRNLTERQELIMRTYPEGILELPIESILERSLLKPVGEKLEW